MKKCLHCKKVKSKTKYYKNSAALDGLGSKCKECARLYARKRRKEKLSDPDWVELERQRNRDKYHRLNYKGKHKQTPEQKRKTVLNYKRKYPEKKRAMSKSSHIRGKNNFQFHHWNYTEGLEKSLLLLTRKDHATLHRFLDYDLDKFIYKTKDGILLDTKQKHIEFAKSIGCTVWANCEF